MEDRTRAYLRGRFRDFYRRSDPELPPDPDAREWGYVPWTSGPDTTMVRHRSLLDLGDVGTFCQRERPRHVYFSAGYYDDPGARSMSEKGWRGSDLVFDIDADHLPDVDPSESTYAEMLAAGKDSLVRLVDLLREDFGFTDLSVAFSGGRGYHVHVRDDAVMALESDERREIVEFVRGNGVELESLVEEEAVGGRGRKTPTTRRTVPTDGGWGRRVVSRIDAFVDDLLAMDEEAAIEHLTEFDRVGEKNARAVLEVVRSNTEQVRAGNVDVHPAFLAVARGLVAETVQAEAAFIDEPVTTDVHRLIRLPGSLHGGSGLAVRPIEADAIEDFDPLADAIPETFRGHEIAVEVESETLLEFDGERRIVSAGRRVLPEYAGIFLMARGQAEKARE
ncbi:MAG: DNA primase small subunit PriS [Halanaeroarchaeum sp.]